MAVTVDGRVDQEKLFELLTEPEQTQLEFKESIDFEKSEGRLNLVKDMVAMANCPQGGYILVGVNNEGRPIPSARTFDSNMRKKFDGATLNDLLKPYIDGPVQVISQLHRVDDCEVVLIYVSREKHLPPIPMGKDGQYSDQNKTKSVFRKGEVWLRENAQNVMLSWSHWDTLLEGRDERVHQKAQEDMNSLLKEFARNLRDPGGHISIPLDIEMSDEVFTETLITNIESGGVRVQQFLTRARGVTANDTQFRAILDKVTIVAVQVLSVSQLGIAEAAVDSLFTVYEETNGQSARAQLEIITRVYVIGAAAVRYKQWEVIPGLVLRSRDSYPGSSYTYSSWIRHGQVNASRADLFPDPNTGGLMIPPALQLCHEHPAMRPDKQGLQDEQSERDPILDSLCQFDILYCVLVHAAKTGDAGAYPASSAYRQERIDPMLKRLVTSQDLRQTLFSNHDDADIAKALGATFREGKYESQKLRAGYWGAPPSEVQEFMDRHRAQWH